MAMSIGANRPNNQTTISDGRNPRGGVLSPVLPDIHVDTAGNHDTLLATAASIIANGASVNDALELMH